MPEDADVVAGTSGGPPGESLSCVTCRSRKLRCDKVKPVCTRCIKVNGDCIYPESRRKPAFKRKNVKELEERLAQVEGLLRQAGGAGLTTPGVGAAAPSAEELTAGAINVDDFETPMTENVLFQGIDYGSVPDISLDGSSFAFGQEDPTVSTGGTSAQPPDDFNGNAFNGELIDLGGVFEALPPFGVMEDLNRLFFERQQQFAPIINPSRYLHAFYSPAHMKPPMCLQYAMWALTSNGDPKYHAYHDVFYKRARQYADMDEMKGYGEHFITIAHAQAWCVLATDEARSMMFTRAAMSCARAVRLSAMMGLHHLDSPPDESSPTILPPKDWAELEERRRVFWGIFCIDSHCSISTGWPHLVDMTQVTTRLPSTEAAFHSGQPMETCTIHDVFKGDHSYSSFSGTIVVCHLFNMILKHAHRPKENDNPENYEYGEYWKRHREIDNTISSAFMFLPELFRLPENYREPTAVNTNLNLHASIICLHHAALERIEKYNLPEFAKRISQDRLSAAAQEIINIIKLTSHLSSPSRTPLAALSLLCAASVYMYFCKENYTPATADNLDFLLSAMEAIGRTHSVTRSFLRQALLDIEQNGIQDIVQLPRVTRLSRNLSTTVSHNVPLLARTRMSRHSEAQPPLPSLPVGKATPRNPPSTSTPWTRPAQNSTTSIAGASSDGHAYKRQRTGTPTSNSSPYTDSSASNGSSLAFSYLPIRSEPPSVTNHHNLEISIPNVARNTESSGSTQNTTVTPNHNRIGVTIGSNILGHRSMKPFTTAGREASQTKASKGGMGSWELGGMCLSSMAGEKSAEGPLHGDDVPAQFVDPEHLGFNWDALEADLGMDTYAPIDTQGEGNENVDSGGRREAPDVG
ncbi:hypothetical protein F5Y09DRAFT_338004 [Xylaria sp. FL1042]|nr:hypothetical protein F5Y09DRAFT_338004 [Xylaria sp. FL1042]